MMIEDILIRIAGDRTLATRYVGNRSPFPDLRADLPYFNAVMAVVTSRGIMEVAETPFRRICAARTGRRCGCSAGDSQDQGRTAISGNIEGRKWKGADAWAVRS